MHGKSNNRLQQSKKQDTEGLLCQLMEIHVIKQLCTTVVKHNTCINTHITPSLLMLMHVILVSGYLQCTCVSYDIL